MTPCAVTLAASIALITVSAALAAGFTITAFISHRRTNRTETLATTPAPSLANG